MISDVVAAAGLLPPLVLSVFLGRKLRNQKCEDMP
jgi:hypothetical protein